MPDRTPFDDVPDVDPDLARRLSAAFGALATTEVPDHAPRPGEAPRPVATDTRRRRRLGLAGGGLLVAAAAVVLALLLGTEVFDARVAATAPPATDVSTTTVPTPTTTTTAPPPSTSAVSTPPPTTTAASPTAPPPPDAATVAAAFAAATTATRSGVVTVPGGYEGADLTGGTTIRLFTSSDGTTWQPAGTSTYPPVFGGGQPASIKAAGLPTGAPHAVFVVSDQYATGDSTGVDVAFSDGTAGFGAVKGGSDGDLHPSGSGVPALGDVGTSFREDFQGGQLVTIDCSATVTDAACGDAPNQIVKYWSWSGDAFVLARRTGPAS